MGIHVPHFEHFLVYVMRQYSPDLKDAKLSEDVTAIIGRDTMIGTQFHPEKSQSAGLKLIGNFLSWAP